MGEVFGIDVSHHNGKIDWKKVAANGIKFAVMKAQYEAKSHNIDETFEYNYAEAGKYGIARGVYIYIAKASLEDPLSDAKALLSKLKGRKLEYGIWLDLEDKSIRNIGSDRMFRLIYVYANLFRAAGYYVGIYCNRDWYYNVLYNKKIIKDFDFWIARYPSKDSGVYTKNSPLSPRAYSVAWQYSSKGSIPGVPTKVDLDVDYDGVVNLIGSEKIQKTIRDIALEVIDDKWGSSLTIPTRKELLTEAGYNYEEVRTVVNQLYRTKV